MGGLRRAGGAGGGVEKAPPLSPRLQALLDKKRLPMNTAQMRLDKTLSKAQEARKAETPLPKDQSEGVALQKADKS